jgi:imidazolonepropionase-like amidohydrolase
MPALHMRGAVLPDGETRDLWIVNGRIRLTPVPYAETVVDGGVLVPGLVDAHCHIGMKPSSLVESIDEVRSLALRDRSAGVLTIRDAGSPIPYGDALDDDPEMPRLVRSGTARRDPPAGGGRERLGQAGG